MTDAPPQAGVAYFHGDVRMRVLRHIANGVQSERALQNRIQDHPRPQIASAIKASIERGWIRRLRGGRLSLTVEGRAQLPDGPRLGTREWVPPRVVRRPGSLDFMRHPSRVGSQRIHREGREKWVS